MTFRCIIFDMLQKTEYNINSVNSLYLLVDEIDGFIEEKEGGKYLNIALTDSNNEVLKYIQSFGAELKNKLKKQRTVK